MATKKRKSVKKKGGSNVSYYAHTRAGKKIEIHKEKRKLNNYG